MSAPTNDNFADAIVLSGSLPITRTGDTNVDATVEVDEPLRVNYGEIDPADEYDTVIASVWYRWTCPASGIYRFRIETSFDSIATVYEGGPGLADLVRIDQGDVNFSGSYAESVYLDGASGTTYYFQVGSYGDEGSIDLELDTFTRPANDRFENATDLGSEIEVSIAGSNIGASAEFGEPRGVLTLTSWTGELITSPGYAQVGWRTVWYRWRGRGGDFIIYPGDHERAYAFDFTTEFAPVVYMGESVGELTPVELTWDFDEYPFGGWRLAAESGQTYYIQIGGYGWNYEGDFTLELYPVPSEPNPNAYSEAASEWDGEFRYETERLNDLLDQPWYTSPLVFADGVWTMAFATLYFDFDLQPRDTVNIYVISSVSGSGPWTVRDLSAPLSAFYDSEPRGFGTYGPYSLPLTFGDGYWALGIGKRVYYWTTDLSDTGYETVAISVYQPAWGTDRLYYPTHLAWGGGTWAVMTASGDVASASQLSGPWTLEERPLPDNTDNTVTGLGVIAYEDGKWVVTYVTNDYGSFYEFTSPISVLTATSPSGPWTLRSQTDDSYYGEITYFSSAKFPTVKRFSNGRWALANNANFLFASSIDGPWVTVDPPSPAGSDFGEGEYKSEGSFGFISTLPASAVELAIAGSNNPQLAFFTEAADKRDNELLMPRAIGYANGEWVVAGLSATPSDDIGPNIDIVVLLSSDPETFGVSAG